MIPYRAPVRDMLFVLGELHDGCRSKQLDLETTRSVLEQAAHFHETVLRPLSRIADEEGCRIENGQVFTAKGFREAFRAFADAGWLSLAFEPRYGGQGLPVSLRVLVEEMTCSANLNFASYTNLILGAYDLLLRNGSQELKDRYLPLLASGTCAATMCLTEPQSGSDLSLLRSRAVQRQDGTYGIFGQKTFISAGDHDLSENILHLVLARLANGPPGTRGISLFLVPKLLPAHDGRALRYNGVRCVSLETKMGLNGSATCVMNFEDATGWLVGLPHRGLPAMFAMMNSARLGASLQGIGIAEAAYQGAVAYARERLQGRAPAGAARPELPADPIVVHPDVRRMLLIMRSSAEGMRGLAQWIARALNESGRAATEQARQEAEEFVSLMTPVLKGCSTELGSVCANLGIQILGGAGYLRGSGMEQLVRDVRVTEIYDGTNGIQALDLVMRKLKRDQLGHRFFEPVRRFLSESITSDISELSKSFVDALRTLEAATAFVESTAQAEPERAASAASDYLRLFGAVAIGFMWLRMAGVAAAHADGPEAPFFRAKLATARFYLRRLPAQASALWQTMAAADAILAVDPETF